MASIAALYFAYRLGVLLSFHWSAHVLLLGYLATDHLQIFFGMAGMETQVAVAIFIGTIYFLLSKKWWRVGISLGLGLICRPRNSPPLSLVLALSCSSTRGKNPSDRTSGTRRRCAMDHLRNNLLWLTNPQHDHREASLVTGGILQLLRDRRRSETI